MTMTNFIIFNFIWHKNIHTQSKKKMYFKSRKKRMCGGAEIEPVSHILNILRFLKIKKALMWKWSSPFTDKSYKTVSHFKKKYKGKSTD